MKDSDDYSWILDKAFCFGTSVFPWLLGAPRAFSAALPHHDSSVTVFLPVFFTVLFCVLGHREMQVGSQKGYLSFGPYLREGKIENK